MPQTFVAVQCAFCHAFQGTLDKKNKRFACSVCGQKQSFRHVHAVSNSGKDIRQVVQELNALRGAQEQALGQVNVQDIPVKSSDSREQKPVVTWDGFAEAESIPDEDAECDAGPYVTAIDSSNSLKGRQKGTGSYINKRQRLQQASEKTSVQQEYTNCGWRSSKPHQVLQDSTNEDVSQQLTHRPHTTGPADQHRRALPNSKRAAPAATGSALSRFSNAGRCNVPSTALWQPYHHPQQQGAMIYGCLSFIPQCVPQQQPQQQQLAAAASAASSAARVHQPHVTQQAGKRPQQQQQQQIAAPTGAQQLIQQRRTEQQQQQQLAGSWHQTQQQQQCAGLVANKRCQTRTLQIMNLSRGPGQQTINTAKPPGASAAANSIWNSFVEETDAYSGLEDDDDDDGGVDEQGFCSLSPLAMAAAAGGAEVQPRLLSRWSRLVDGQQLQQRSQ